MSEEKNKNSTSNFAKFSQIGFQMAATIGAGAYIGHFIDGKMEGKIPIFTIIFSLSAIGISLYIVIKQLPKE